MIVSGGNVTITESKASRGGGSRGVGRFLVLEQGTRDAPPKKWRAERHGLCSFAAEGSSSSRLERIAGRCNRCSNAASHIFKTNLVFTWASG